MALQDQAVKYTILHYKVRLVGKELNMHVSAGLLVQIFKWKPNAFILLKRAKELHRLKAPFLLALHKLKKMH
jgi:hypothetical protein